MTLGRLFRGLFRTPSGLVLAAGAVGVLVGIEYWMSCGTTRRARSETNPRPLKETVPAAAPRNDYFKISQTRSEIGLVYWVLQGFGRYKCFVLLDTWQEAMDEAVLRSTAVVGEEAQLVYAGTSRVR